MLFYFVVLIFIIVIGCLAQYNNSKGQEQIAIAGYSDINFYKNHYGIFYYVLVLFMIFVSGFRYGVGSDFFSYYNRKDIPKEDIINSFREFEEPGMKVLTNIANTLWKNPQNLILIASILTISLVFYGISKLDNNNITFMLLIYIFIGGWLFSFNGVRQALAISIVFAFSYLYSDFKNKKIFAILIVIFIAFLFHKSAIMMIPLIIISRRKFDARQMVIVVISAIVIPYLFGFMFDFMDTNVTDDDALEYIEREINPIRIAVAIAPVILLFFVSNKRRFFDEHRFIVNMAVFNALLHIVTANSAYLNRFTKFTAIYLVLFIPISIKNINTKSLRFLATIITVILYCGFWIYEINNGSSYLPFEFCFEYM